MTTRPPLVAWLYGLLGLVPFVAGALASLLLVENSRILAQFALLTYGAIILTFLGGGRWGLEIGRDPVRPAVIGGSMAPAMGSVVLLALGGVPASWRLCAMALGFLVMWAWDVRSPEPPPWYPRLRHVLTAGAVVCLFTGAAAPLLPA